MYLLIIFFSLLGSIFSFLLGRYIGRIGCTIFTLGSVFMSVVLSWILFWDIALSSTKCNIFLYQWLDMGFLIIDFGFMFDTVTIVMICIICFISLLVHFYSIEYMLFDNAYNRFMSYLSIFTFFMIFLVSSDNFIQMFIGWEGVGLSSYLLISFWYTRVLANKAAIKAMLLNRIGDLCLLLAICLIFHLFGTLKYSVVFLLVPYFIDLNIYFLGFYFNCIDLICFFLFIGAMGKSAQIGLHIWLPDAMEGPTPVSALIHAATMVTAGVFLIIRCSFIFEFSNNILVFIGLIGSFTCLFSAIVGVFQFDIKRIVAYSTCSQLGYMFFSCSLSNYNVGLFHLFNHAFFKALLFLSMGSIIHAMSDEQDFRKMGGLVNLLPFTYVMVMISSLSLLALPFLTGFYSKDMILEFTYSRFVFDSLFIYFLGIMSAFLTAFYSIRLIYWVFLGSVNFYKSNLSLIIESGFFMVFPMFILSFLSIFIGYLFNEAFIGIGNSLFWNNSIFLLLYNYSFFDVEFNLFMLKFIPLIITLLGIIFFFFSIYFFEKIFFFFFKNKKIFFFYKIFSKALFFDFIIIDFFFLNLLKISYLNIYKYIEKGFFELIFYKYVYNFFFVINSYLVKLNSGLIYNYIFLIIFLFVFFFFIIQILFIFSFFHIIIIFYGFFFTIYIFL